MIDQKVYSDDSGKLWSYLSKVHQIFTQRSQMIGDVNTLIGIAISNPFRNARAMNEGEESDFAYCP